MFKYEKSKKLGNEEFREIFLELYPDLCLYALKFLNDLDESKYIVQELGDEYSLEPFLTLEGLNILYNNYPLIIFLLWQYGQTLKSVSLSMIGSPNL